MKKIASLILAVCISLTFSACSQSGSADLTLRDRHSRGAGGV